MQYKLTWLYWRILFVQNHIGRDSNPNINSFFPRSDNNPYQYWLKIQSITLQVQAWIFSVLLIFYHLLFLLIFIVKFCIIYVAGVVLGAYGDSHSKLPIPLYYSINVIFKPAFSGKEGITGSVIWVRRIGGSSIFSIKAHLP